MRIVELRAENVKRLKAVEVRPEQGAGLVIIAGNNEQGKSSLLDSIWMALGGGRAIPPEPIRRGQKKAEIELTLDGEAGPLKVTRSFTAKGTYLRVEDAAGAAFKSPQQILDELLGAHTFDPQEFARMKPPAQREALLEIADVSVDLDEFEEHEAELVEDRKRLRAQRDQAVAFLEGLPEMPATAPSKRVEMSEVVGRLKAARVEDAACEATEREAGHCIRVVTAQEEVVADAKEELQKAERALVHMQKSAAEAQAKADAMQRPDLAAIEAEISGAEKINREVDAAETRQHAEGAVTTQQAQLTKAETDIKALRETRDEALEAAQMPIEGLGVTAEGVAYEGLPFENASDSQQLKVSTAIAMAVNPKLRVLRVKEGSLLDPDSLETLRKMAQERDFDIWIERVGEDCPGAIIIEDGQIKEAVGTSVAADREPVPLD